MSKVDTIQTTLFYNEGYKFVPVILWNFQKKTCTKNDALHIKKVIFNLLPAKSLINWSKPISIYHGMLSVPKTCY